MVIWDWKQDPPFEEIESCINDLLHRGATQICLADSAEGTDSYRLVISDRMLTQAELSVAWRYHLDNFEDA